MNEAVIQNVRIIAKSSTLSSVEQYKCRIILRDFMLIMAPGGGGSRVLQYSSDLRKLFGVNFCHRQYFFLSTSQPHKAPHTKQIIIASSFQSILS